MPVDFKQSQTKDNLMRAFAGESQARNRYTIGAAKAKKEKLHVIEAIFTFTANQEREHGEIFYIFLSGMAGETIHINGGYPVDIDREISGLLRKAAHNEYEEHDDVYKCFGDTARAEGFLQIAAAFYNIAEIEQFHGERFEAYARLLEENKLFVAEAEVGWMCLNCGHIHQGRQAPAACPVCHHDQGYFIRLSLAPYFTGRSL